MAKQVKSKERVADHGEVFTAEREVNAMLDLVKHETENIESTFLEPACGDGNFLAEILRRKLAVVKKKYKKNPDEYEFWSVIAVSSIYGVELLSDNAAACRKRLFDIWDKEYTKNCKYACDDCRETIKFILEKNILLGNALSMKCVDLTGNDIDDQPIIFAEWSFMKDGLKLKRRDFRLDVLLMENSDGDMYQAQFSLFADDASNIDFWEIDPETLKPVPKAIREYPYVYYRKVKDYE